MLAMPGRHRCRDTRIEDALDVGSPGHADRATVFQHDDGVGIGSGDGGYQRVLLIGG